MTEKRFILYSDDYFFGAYDKVAQEKIDVLGSIYLLNSLSEENERLSERLIEKRDELETENVILKKENEQLKRQNKALKDSSLIDAYNQYIKTCTIQSNRE